MKRKGDALDALDLLFHQDGVPPKMVMDGSKEQTQGRFRKKLKLANVHVKKKKPFSPRQCDAKNTVRKLKRGSGRKMVQAGAPKPLWADCIEFETYVQSNTAWDLYKL